MATGSDPRGVRGEVPDRRSARRVTINFVVYRNRTARWEADYYMPCDNRSIGSDDPRQVPPLRFRNGRFSLREHIFNSTTQFGMRFVFSGHVVGRGLAGSFQATQTDDGITCSTGPLHWTAAPGKAVFWHTPPGR